MDIAIGIVFLLICIVQPLLLLGLGLIFMAMAVFSRPFKWKDLAVSLGVMGIAVALIQWNGGWDRMAMAANDDHWEYRGSYDDTPTFDNCTDDCSGHEAGYRWAEDNDIMDRDDCDGRSNSFNEGCEQYVEEQQYLEIEPYQDAQEMSGRFGY